MDWERLLSEQVRLNGKLLFGLAYGVLRDSQGAEDVCQYALLQAWKERNRIREVENLKGWLAKTVMNESMRIVRRRRMDRKWILRVASLTPRLEESPSRRIDANDAAAVALEKLSEEQRAIVMLRVMQEMAGKDVAEMLGVSESYVSRHMHRGMERLREILAEDRVETDGKR